MKLSLDKVTEKVMEELAYRVHLIKLVSEELKIRDTIALVGDYARQRTWLSGSGNPGPEVTRYTKTREYLNQLADLILSHMPKKYSVEGLNRANQEMRHYGMPKVNGEYPKLA